ncbi:hypothetical protein Rs2_50394 [Raphanus sativus]|uniref:Uncharacterized protein LOC130505489 n=1 Tax=Raphanus sativus TaxID=3726 RepID=A0A9W3CWV6_RAPSA|nr:uncharacterized protein LOC130505489 [Raphanus sativus]KAJ4868058.1 hypothetical protein Rs2_50394 [Raphanus sativus]
MATCTMTVTEYFCPPKKRRLDKASGESKSSATGPNLRPFNPDDDECIRQYILYYYQFQKSEGFDIDWDKLDYRFATMPIIDAYPAGYTMTNDEIISEVTCLAIAQRNAEKGTRLVFLDHVSASYRCCAGCLYYITFWAMDLASSRPEPKLYQTKCRQCGPTFCEIYIFRLKPTDEEIAAVQVDPPPPLNENDPEAATISFTITGPGSGFIPNVVFTRTPAQVSVPSAKSSSPCESQSQDIDSQYQI